MNENEIVFCKKCVISNLRPTSTKEGQNTKGEIKPTTNFTDGVCDACIWAEIKETKIDWELREKELYDLCNQHRKSDGNYDVIVPASGGKDSVYVAHLLKHKYGMNPLTITWAPNIPTEIGQRNQYNLVKSGFNNMLISPNGEVHRKLTSFAFKNLGHPFQPFIFGQRSVGPKIALKYNISLIFYGENVAEYGNNYKDNYSPIMDPELYTCYDTDNDLTRLGGVSVKELREKYNFSKADLLPYKSPSMEEIENNDIEIHYMSYYRKWVPQENFYYAVQNTFFEPAPVRSKGSYSKYSGVDDKIEWLHFYMMFIKFGMGRATADAAQEIRSGKISREEAVSLVNLYDNEFPDEFLPDFLEYMSIEESEFFDIIDSFRPEHLWELIDNKWRIKHKVS